MADRHRRSEMAPVRRDETQGWQLRQPHPGTRITRYRCFLPDLAEFAGYRRGRTDGAAINLSDGAG